MPKTVAILGNASHTREACPFDDLNVDIWVMTIHAYKAKRRNAVLEMHPDVLTGERWRKYPEAEQYRKWLRETRIPIYMHQPLPEVPAAIRYPREEIEAQYGHHLWKGDKEHTKMYGGTASYAVALAMLLGYERIELYGIELSSRPDYDDERDCFFFWIGKATTLGIDVVGQENTRLIRDIFYP